jgi:hypothetical protein
MVSWRLDLGCEVIPFSQAKETNRQLAKIAVYFSAIATTSSVKNKMPFTFRFD